jgi:cytochrome c553
MTGVTRSAVAALALWGFAVQAQAPAGDTGGPVWRGVYSAEQASSGATTYASMCASCHRDDLTGGPSGGATAPPLAGDAFFARWDATSLNRLFRTIRETMPRGSGGSLSDEAAVELVAFILRFNGFPAGATALGPQPALLDKLLITPKPGTSRPVTNFSVVQVTGCISQAPNGRWVLTDDTNQRYRLVGAAPFKVDARAGERVRATGLIRRDPAETLLNLTDVAPSGARCGT